MKMKPTPGKYKIADGNFIYVLNKEGTNRIHAQVTAGYENTSSRGRDYKRTEADEVNATAQLFAEAGTVHHETGLSPRELLEQRDDAIRHLRELLFCGPTKSAQAELTARAFFVTIAATRETKGEG